MKIKFKRLFILNLLFITIGITKNNIDLYEKQGLCFSYPSGAKINDLLSGEETIVTIKTKEAVIVEVRIIKQFVNLLNYAEKYSRDSLKRMSKYGVSSSRFKKIEKPNFNANNEIFEDFAISIMFNETKMFRHYFYKKVNNKNLIVMLQGKLTSHDEILSEFYISINTFFNNQCEKQIGTGAD